jgi:hypothetical protein
MGSISFHFIMLKMNRATRMMLIMLSAVRVVLLMGFPSYRMMMARISRAAAAVIHLKAVTSCKARSVAVFIAYSFRRRGGFTPPPPG